MSDEIRHLGGRALQSRSAVAVMDILFMKKKKHTTRKIKRHIFTGEFAMNQKSTFLIVALLALGLSAQLFAAGTPAGTTISNIAYGGYSDANGNVIADVDNASTRIQSNTVTTTVAQVYGVDVESTQSMDLPRNTSVTYAMTVENTGNGDDTFDLSQVTTGSGYTVTIYEDTDADGVHDAGEAVTSGTGSIAADAVYHFVVVVEDADGTQGEQYVTTVTATSQGSGSETDNSVLTSTVQAALITGTLAPDATSKAPGDVITYTATFSNSNDANSETAYGVTVSLPVPSNCAWVGNVTLDATPTGTGEGVDVTVGNVAAGGSHIITYQVQVNAGVPQNTTIDNQVDIDYNDSSSDPYTQVNLLANDVTSGRVTVTEVNGFTTAIAPASQSGDPGDVVRYLVTVTNTGNGSDSYTLSLNSSSQSWTWTFYTDDEDNGTWDGTETATANSGSVAAGGSQGMWAVATIPAGTADAIVDASIFRFTSVDNNTLTSDETGTTTVTAPILGLAKTVSPTGEQPPGTTLTYSVDVTNSGTGDATNVVIKDGVPANTTYVSSSLEIDSTGKTDAVDADNAQCDGSTAQFNVGTVSSGATVTIQFQVTID